MEMWIVSQPPGEDAVLYTNAQLKGRQCKRASSA